MTVAIDTKVPYGVELTSTGSLTMCQDRPESWHPEEFERLKAETLLAAEAID
jgi:hypothetical protein